MLLVSKGFKNQILGPHAFADIFAGGELRLFSGTRPVTADLAEPRAPIGVITGLGPSGPGLSFVLVGTYVVNRSDGAWRFLANQPGTVGWWRLVAADDTGTDTQTEPRIDGDVGDTTSPSDLTLTKLTFTAGETLAIDSFLYTLPPAGN